MRMNSTYIFDKILESSVHKDDGNLSTERIELYNNQMDVI